VRLLLAALLAAAALTACGDDPPRADQDDLDRQYLDATVSGDLEALDRALADGADVNAKDSYNGTGLIRAADAGQVAMVRRLLRTEIDKDHVNELGWTALLEAVILGGGDREHTEIVRLLVEGGVDTRIRDREGNTALDIAEDRGYDDMVQILRNP
jgi:ankyrin repeat protein